MPIPRPATPDDVPALVRVINAAYVVEAWFVDGPRTSAGELRAMLARPGAAFLVVDDEESGAGPDAPPGALAAAVYLEARGERAYLGMLSVDPRRQGRGYGRLLVEAAQAWARAAECRFVDISVVNLRRELAPFYAALGFAPYGTAPFPQPARLLRDAHLVLMTKPLAPLFGDGTAGAAGAADGGAGEIR
jgi:GNAT superfamily N-acetyltransferase